MIDESRLRPAAQMIGEDEEETASLLELYNGAAVYLRRQKWCQEIHAGYLGFGVGGVVGVFLFDVTRSDGEREPLWVVEGDLPSAYLLTDNANDPAEALQRYCELMQEWVVKARRGESLDSVFPVPVPPEVEYVDMLASRVRTLRESFVPAATADWESRAEQH